MFIRNWSPAKKANAAIFSALVLALMVYALSDTSPEPRTVLSKPAVPTLTAVSPNVGLSTEALVHPRSLIVVGLAAC